MITYSWALFMSKDVPIYVHYMQFRFGEEIVPDMPCILSLLVIQESKFMREYIWYFGYYFT